MNSTQGGGGCLRQDATLERPSNGHLAQLSFKDTIFYRAFSKINAFSIFCPCGGFTLAEVLITLGIIGIVAAMTMPVLVEKHKKQVFVTKIKYAYTIIANAFLSAKADYGDPTEWDWGTEFTDENTERIIKTYFSPYLSKTEEGLTHKNHYYYIKLKNGVTLTLGLDGCSDQDTCSEIYVNTIYIMASLNGNTSYILDKSRDYSREDAVMRFTKHSKGLLYFNWGGKMRENVINHEEYGCNSRIPKNKRLNCGQLIFLDGWQIKDDYPW